MSAPFNLAHSVVDDKKLQKWNVVFATEGLYIFLPITTNNFNCLVSWPATMLWPAIAKLVMVHIAHLCVTPQYL